MCGYQSLRPRDLDTDLSPALWLHTLTKKSTHPPSLIFRSADKIIIIDVFALARTAESVRLPVTSYFRMWLLCAKELTSSSLLT